MEEIFKIPEGALNNASSLEIAKNVVRILDAKKAGDIKLLRVEDKTVITDYFVICTGTSRTQLKSLADEVEYQLGVGGVPFLRLEGNDCDDWKVIDCRDVIVHVFNVEARGFYKLEKLWADAEEIDISGLTNEE